MNFDLPAPIIELQRRVRDFVRTQVIPQEAHERDEEGLPDDLLADIRQKARDAGVWAPQLPVEYGGQGLNTVGLCAVFEEAGYSPLGPLAMHCAAPDEGNMHLLHKAASPAQRERFLKPLIEGRTRSCFALTEPAPGAGSDPTMIRTRAERVDGRWVLNGDKWFTSGAMGAAFCIVAAVTDPTLPPKEKVSLFLIEAGTPGFVVKREIPVMTSGGPGGHCEVSFQQCAVSDDCVLGKLGQGFALMQQRLGPARLTHCMRWLGAARRAIDIALPYVRQRQAFGKHLADHQAVQWMLADSAADLHAGRLMTYHAAWLLDKGEQARAETSMCKFVVAEAVGRVIDRAVQLCGASGLVRGNMLERLYRDARAFRIYDGPSEVHRMVVARDILKGA